MLDIATITIYADQGVIITNQASDEVTLAINALPSLGTFIQHIESYRPEEANQNSYKRVDINWGIAVHYKAPVSYKPRNAFSVKWEDLDQNLVETLRQEISTL